MSELTPKEIVTELDRFIIGQSDAKRAVAVALRNRWRRKQLPKELQEEVYPKNILMIGPTGVGKTEISRRLAKLDKAPFIKVEATKYTEVGYVGRDVEQIIRDLTENATHTVREQIREEQHEAAYKAAEDRVVEALVGPDARDATKEKFREKVRSGELNAKEIELDLEDNSNPMQMLDVPGHNIGMLNVGEILSKTLGSRTVKKKTTVEDSYKYLVEEEADKLIDMDSVHSRAIEAVEQNGIVFLDEIDKLCAKGGKEGGRGGDVSREGVQRDLLPLIEGTTVSTKYGSVNTDHILFIASGAFHTSKPSDMLPELQGRLPIRVELRSLTEEDFMRILAETDNALTRQYEALMATEGLKVSFTKSGIVALAKTAAQVNQSVENIGARRLYTIMEKVFEDISFDAPSMKGQKVKIDAKYVADRVSDLAKSVDLSQYVL